jgi:hypothetical protein
MTEEAVGGGYAGLRRAAERARAGRPVSYREPRLRAGGAFATESFLTPFRFNLGPGVVGRDEAAGLRVIEPEWLLVVGDLRLGRDNVDLSRESTVAATLAANDVDRDARTLLTAHALLLGVDPEAAGSGHVLAAAAARLQDAVLIAGGNGLAAALLVDEIVAAGGSVVEGTSPWLDEPPLEEGLGICRLFIGLRGYRRPAPGFACAYGFSDEASLTAGLAELRRGTRTTPFGFVLSNEHLDAGRPDDPLSSLVWQGIVPTRADIARDRYISDVLDGLEIDDRDVIFRLLWLPGETREVLGDGHDLIERDVWTST